MRKEPVKIWARPSKDGSSFTFCLIYTDLEGKRRRKSLGHLNKRKAQREAAELTATLANGFIESDSMRLSKFSQESLARTGSQIRKSSRKSYQSIMDEFIRFIGDIDYQAVRLFHGERFVQYCYDKGNSNDTIAKKVRTLKRFYNLALERGQITENSFRFLKAPKRIKKVVRVLSDNEYSKLVKIAHDRQGRFGVRWEVLIILAVVTGMRKGELLNLTWGDVDFDRQTVTVRAKPDSKQTWAWEIKDSEERTLPLTDEICDLLADHQQNCPVGVPYIFVPLQRYKKIMSQKMQGDWDSEKTRLYIVTDFTRHFNRIKESAGIQRCSFHDLRRTALSQWLNDGMSVYDVMKLAGHSSIETTQKFYLATSSDLLDRARASKGKAVCQDLLHFCYTGSKTG